MWGPRGPGAPYPSPAAKGAPIFSFAPIAQVEQSIPVLVGSLIILVLSLGIHEAAHGWVALKCGDTTAKDLGRVIAAVMGVDDFAERRREG